MKILNIWFNVDFIKFKRFKKNLRIKIAWYAPWSKSGDGILTWFQYIFGCNSDRNMKFIYWWKFFMELHRLHFVWNQPDHLIAWDNEKSFVI